jgi:hypothetical protein
MVRRVVMVAIGAALFACATIVGDDVSRDPGSAVADDDDGATFEGGPEAAADVIATPDAEQDAQSVLGCSCAIDKACCIASGAAPACVAPDAGGCESTGSFLLACTRSLPADGRDCCWNDTGPLHQTRLGAGCKPNRTACIDDGDCLAPPSPCTKIVCGAVTMGVCASSAPADFVCP